MRRMIALPLLATLLLAAASARPAPPQRIVSLNLCADQLLLALADRRQIVALTSLARDPEMSAAAAEARGLPTIRGSAEEVLALRPDLILAAPGWRTGAMARLRERGLAAIELPPAESLAEIRAQIRQVATAIGHPARGEALVARMDARLARLPLTPASGRTVAHYQRRGYVTGTGTLVDELIRRAGLTNIATRLGKPALSRVSLEEMALARPDYLLVETSDLRVVDRGTELLRHPLLSHITRLTLPQSWLICGGSAYVLAAESLSRQLPAR